MTLSKRKLLFSSMNLTDSKMKFLVNRAGIKSFFCHFFVCFLVFLFFVFFLSGLPCCNFPKHVYECGKKNNKLKEPFFKAYAFFALTDPRMLLREENKLFKAGHSLLNS